MKTEKIKPVPKYILERIRKEDLKRCPDQQGAARYYAYLTKNDGKLVKVTVAVKNHRKQWHYKQCAVHGIHSEQCFLKDMVFFYLGVYRVGWYDEGLQKYQKWYEDGKWDRSGDKYFDPWAPIVNREIFQSFPNIGTALTNFTTALIYSSIYELTNVIRKPNIC